MLVFILIYYYYYSFPHSLLSHPYIHYSFADDPYPIPPQAPVGIGPLIPGESRPQRVYVPPPTSAAVIECAPVMAKYVKGERGIDNFESLQTTRTDADNEFGTNGDNV